MLVSSSSALSLAAHVINHTHTHTSIQCRELMRNEMIDLYMNMVRVTIIQLQLRLRLS